MLLKLIQNGFYTGHPGHVCGNRLPTHTPAHTYTQHHKYGCNIITPKTTDTLPINTSSTRAEGLKCKNHLLDLLDGMKDCTLVVRLKLHGAQDT